MANRNSSRRRSKKNELKKKTAPPIGLITVGIGIILIGIAALFLMPEAEAAANEGAPDEYSAIPMEVDYSAPELTLADLEGKPESLEDYRGQVVMVNLWATWCPPCIAEIPMLQEYYEDHSADGFVMLGIDSQEKPDVVAAYIEKTGVTYPIWADEKGEAGRAFSSMSLPASFIIDRDGTVRLAWTGAVSRTVLEKYVTPIIEE